MKITVNRINDAYLMEAENEEGAVSRMDASADMGGVQGGLSPQQMLLAAVGGCSAIDIIKILKKQKQDLKDIKVELEGERIKRDTYKEFTDIHLHFILSGDLDPKKVERAIDLSLDKYCSVAKALEHTATITHDYTIENTA